MTTSVAGLAVEPRVQAAVNEVWASDGVRLDVVGKSKSLLKFGRHTTVGTTRTLVWSNEAETEESLLSTNGVTTAVSTSTADVGKQIYYEYHRISGTDLTFGADTVTLNGTTPVTLPTAGARLNRARNSGSTNLVGAVSFYEGGADTDGVVDDSSEVHLLIPAGQQQGRKAATAISSADYYLITMWHGHLVGSNTARVDVELEKKSTSGVWLPTGLTMGLGTAGTTGSPTQLDPVTIIPANHDVRATAEATASGTSVQVYFGGYLASII